MKKYTHPILTCNESIEYESHLLGDDTLKIEEAMHRVGCKIGHAVLEDFSEWRDLPRDLEILVLIGKGHNGGDAIIAASEILRLRPRSTLTLVFVLGQKDLKPLLKSAFDHLKDLVKSLNAKDLKIIDGTDWCGTYDICLDGILGMSFKPPLKGFLEEAISKVNRDTQIGLRAAVDLPSGLTDETPLNHLAFRADFTYATGILKSPLLNPNYRDYVGRIRYLDLGFFDQDFEKTSLCSSRILTHSILNPLTQLRKSTSHKKDYGHLFIVGGSRKMPGALLMNVKAALKSGVGLVTAFGPESVVPTFSAVAPEAMWLGWAESDAGEWTESGKEQLIEHLSSASAVLIGSGMGRNTRTTQLIRSILPTIQELRLPIVLDADALMPEVLNFNASLNSDSAELDEAYHSDKREPASKQILITPHRGEFERLGGKENDLKSFSKSRGVVTLLKGSPTRISDGEVEVYSPFGGPVLSRGGSGDVLSGILGGLVASSKDSLLEVTCRGTAWHGLAADSLARKTGQVSAKATDIIAHLPLVLRGFRY